jgi:cytochrome c oxidase assembly protein subunit 11
MNDTDAKFAKHITLSYTFHEIELPEETQAMLETEQLDSGSLN